MSLIKNGAESCYKTAGDIMDILNGFEKAQIMHVATSLGLIDEMNRRSSPTSACSLASSLGLPPDSTERLLNACVAISLVMKTFDINGEALYRNSEFTEKFLVTSSPSSMVALVTHFVGNLYPIWGQLRNSVQQGKKQPIVATQTNSDNSFDVDKGFYSTNNKMFETHRCLQALIKMDVEHVLKAFDLGEFRKACDAGGGSGALGSALARVYPEMDVKVLDLEHVRSVFNHFQSNQQPSNLSFEAKDFFVDELPKSDLFIICRCVHNWDDEHLSVLLKNVYNSLKPGGALLVIEKVLNDAKDGPLLTVLLDLTMMTGCGGRERTAAEHRRLLEEHGFVDVQVRVIAESSWSDVILARKPQQIEAE